MQHRIEAGLRKYRGDNLTIINYAAYSAEVIVRYGTLCYQQDIPGMWEMDEYISLLMGMPFHRTLSPGNGIFSALLLTAL